MTNSEKLSFILEKEMTITMAVTQGKHRATDSDRFVEDREKIKQYRVDLGIIKWEPIEPIMDEFDKTLKLLHESTHDRKIRKSILMVQEYKTTYLDKK
tara:strand:+ start:532 stop:825 length:294 start_codon:yes stop_codon:yes gene_type:complete